VSLRKITCSTGGVEQEERRKKKPTTTLMLEKGGRGPRRVGSNPKKNVLASLGWGQRSEHGTVDSKKDKKSKERGEYRRKKLGEGQ